MMKTHRPGIHEGYLVHHRLRLSGLDSHKAAAICEEIDGLPGVDEVRFDEKRKGLRVSYDASKHHIDEMIGIARRHGANPSRGWWNRTRLSWSRQIDQNVRDNAHYHPSCCNKVPSGAHSRHS